MPPHCRSLLNSVLVLMLSRLALRRWPLQVVLDAPGGDERGKEGHNSRSDFGSEAPAPMSRPSSCPRVGRSNADPGYEAWEAAQCPDLVQVDGHAQGPHRGEANLVAVLVDQEEKEEQPEDERQVQPRQPQGLPRRSSPRRAACRNRACTWAAGSSARVAGRRPAERRTCRTSRGRATVGQRSIRPSPASPRRYCPPPLRPLAGGSSSTLGGAPE